MREHVYQTPILKKVTYNNRMLYLSQVNGIIMEIIIILSAVKCIYSKFRLPPEKNVHTKAVIESCFELYCFGTLNKRSNPITDILPGVLCDSMNNDALNIQIRGRERNKHPK